MITEFISPEMLGVLLIGVMLFAIFIGFPISFTVSFLFNDLAVLHGHD